MSSAKSRGSRFARPHTVPPVAAASASAPVVRPGRGGERIGAGRSARELRAGISGAAPRVAQHERTLVTQGVTMHAVRDRYEAIEIAATYRAALVFCGDGDLERVLDGLGRAPARTR
jgi:hypothetical protein